MAIVMADIGNGLIMIFNVLVIIKMMRGMALMIMIMMLIIMPLRMTMITTTRTILLAGRPNRESAVDAGGEGGGEPRGRGSRGRTRGASHGRLAPSASRGSGHPAR